MSSDHNRFAKIAITYTIKTRKITSILHFRRAITLQCTLNTDTTTVLHNRKFQRNITEWGTIQNGAVTITEWGIIT